MAVVVDAGNMPDRRAVRVHDLPAYRHGVPDTRRARQILDVAGPLPAGSHKVSGASGQRRAAPGPRVLVRGRPAATACLVRPAARPLRYLLALALASAFVVVLLAALGSAADDSVVPTTTSVVQVKPGETLWDIARNRVPTVDPAAVVNRIRELNHLESSAIEVGEPLRVPDGGRSAAG